MDRIKMLDVPSKEQLADAITHTRGFLLAAKQHLQKEFGLHVSSGTIKALIHEYNLVELLQNEKAALLKECKEKKKS